MGVGGLTWHLQLGEGLDLALAVGGGADVRARVLGPHRGQQQHVVLQAAVGRQVPIHLQTRQRRDPTSVGPAPHPRPGAHPLRPRAQTPCQAWGSRGQRHGEDLVPATQARPAAPCPAVTLLQVISGAG